MFIIPIGHENDTVRRLPWVTFGLMAVCVAVNIVVSIQMASARKALETKFVDFVTYCAEHPSLEPNRATMVRLMGERNADRFFRELEAFQAQVGPETGYPTEEDQARFDALALDLTHAVEGLPTRTLGYIPAEKNIPGLFSGMFVHSGWLHLLGNLLFLYLTAPFIEDVWGRALFFGFYLAAGVFSAFLFGLHYPQLTVPLIGASGAIAGVMGAFLVRYWKTRIEFFYLFFFFVRGTFKAPAFVMLPIWFFLELFNAGAMDKANPGSGGVVAHWAHVWGFAFGLAVAFGVMKLRAEERYIAPKIDAQLSYVDTVSEQLESVLALKRERRLEEAFAQARDLAAKNPGREDVIRVLWGLAVETGQEIQAARPMASLIEREIRRSQLEAAADDYRSMKRAAQETGVSPAAKIELARHLQKSNDPDGARELLSEALGRLEAGSPAGLLIDAVKLGAALNSPKLVRRAIELCLLNADVPAEQKVRFTGYLEKLPR